MALGDWLGCYEGESEVAQSFPTLCNPMDCSPPFSVYGIFQARILHWVAISFSRGSSGPRDRTQICHIAAAAAAAAKSLQPCPTLCDLTDGSPPGSPVPGILQARTLEWVPLPSPSHIAGRCFYRLSPNGSQSLSCLCSMYRIHSLPVFHRTQLNSKG